MMDREAAIRKCWDRSAHVDMRNSGYREHLTKLFRSRIREDKGRGDATCAATGITGKATATIRAKEAGVIAGLAEMCYLLKRFSPKRHVNDGERVQKNDIILTLKGNARDLLLLERSALNILQRMCGIATLTREFQKRAGKGFKITATRKTLLSLLDKKAIAVGGGLTHRLNLDDGILIKDNHLTQIGSIERAIRSATRKDRRRIIETEVDTKAQAEEAANIIASLESSRPYALLLDNMTSTQIKDTIAAVKKIDKKDQILFEASGGITMTNIESYAKTGVDVISLGALTHSVKALDISMKLVR